MGSVGSMPVLTVNSRTLSSTRTSLMASRGVSRPHSTSGQTGIHSTKRPNVSVRKTSRLWPPSKRTCWPSRHAEMPIRIGRGRRVAISHRTAVIGPVQHGLPLPSPAVEVGSSAMLADGRDVPPDRPPSPNLPRVVARPPAHVIPAVPLKPSARILRMDPAVSAPLGERLRRVYAEVVEARVMTVGTQFRAGEPARRKLAAAIGHVLAAEDAKAQHLLRRQLRFERGREVPPDWFGPVVDVTLLHHVVDNDPPPHWLTSACGVSSRRSTSYPLRRASAR